MAMNDRYRHDIGSPVGLLITLTAAGAGAALALAGPTAVDELAAHPLRTFEFLLLTLALQITSIPVHGSGRISVSAVGILATGFVLGPGAAMSFAFLAALVQWISGRGLLHRAIFDAAQFILSAGAGALVYRGGESLTSGQGAPLSTMFSSVSRSGCRSPSPWSRSGRSASAGRACITCRSARLPTHRRPRTTRSVSSASSCSRCRRRCCCCPCASISSGHGRPWTKCGVRTRS